MLLEVPGDQDQQDLERDNSPKNQNKLFPNQQKNKKEMIVKQKNKPPITANRQKRRRKEKRVKIKNKKKKMKTKTKEKKKNKRSRQARRAYEESIIWKGRALTRSQRALKSKYFTVLGKELRKKHGKYKGGTGGVGFDKKYCDDHGINLLSDGEDKC